MTSPILFFLDFVSTYSYFAALQIDEVGRRHGRQVHWQVVSLPHVFRLAGTLSPLEQPHKLAHNRRDVERVARQLGVAFHRIATPPDVQAARLLFHRIRRTDLAGAGRFAREAIALRFGQGLELDTPDVLERACQAAGIDAALAQGVGGDAQAKADLVAATGSAVQQHGMFGAPFAVADGEPFWGHDRVTSQLDWWLDAGAPRSDTAPRKDSA